MRSILKLALAVAAFAALALLVWTSSQRSGSREHSSAAVSPVAPAPSAAVATNFPVTTAAPPGEFRPRPFAVARESGHFGWTAEDGRDTNVIRQLAHNELEYQRMVEENDRIFRRQLVYRNETAAALVQRARLTGAPVQQFTLPGLDGQEVQFEITQADLNPSGLQGAFAGRVAGRPDSMVTFAFKGGREAFTVISPSEGLYLQGDPREPGEVIVKSIDPATYVVGVCGTP